MGTSETEFYNQVKKYAVKGIAGFFVFCTLMGSFGIVGPGQRGIRVTMGKTGDEVLGEGPHLKVPFFSEIRKMSVRIHKTEDNAEAATRDIQTVTAKFALNWTINPQSVGQMLREIGDEESIETNIIMPAVPEVLKAATAKMTAEEVLARRTELKEEIDKALIKRLTAYGLVIKDISLVDLNFTHQFNKAVEDKQIAQQRAQQAEYEAQKATNDAHARVNEAVGQATANLKLATAQAEAQKLLKQTLTPEVLQLEYLKKWNGQLPTVLTGNGGGIMFNINGTDSFSRKSSAAEAVDKD